MNEYTFKPQLVSFQAPKYIEFDEVAFIKLNESIDEIKIIINANAIEDAITKADQELKTIIIFNYGIIPNIQFYRMTLKVIKIKNL